MLPHRSQSGRPASASQAFVKRRDREARAEAVGPVPLTVRRILWEPHAHRVRAKGVPHWAAPVLGCHAHRAPLIELGPQDIVLVVHRRGDGRRPDERLEPEVRQDALERVMVAQPLLETYQAANALGDRNWLPRAERPTPAGRGPTRVRHRTNVQGRPGAHRPRRSRRPRCRPIRRAGPRRTTP